MSFIIVFNDTATTEIYTLSLHDALPIFWHDYFVRRFLQALPALSRMMTPVFQLTFLVLHGLQKLQNLAQDLTKYSRSEEHTSELQSRQYLVCRLLLEKQHVLVVLLVSPS